ncbi:MAG: hypothetical protein LBS53_14035 [Synergistaceae bacterium]|nr:hypothetical protein [Synergistaceae bacterium]
MRALRSEGLLERIGNQGRRITESGKDVLGKLQKKIASHPLSKHSCPNSPRKRIWITLVRWE